MKLIALVIKQYNKLFEEQIINFSDEYKVDFYFETNELRILDHQRFKNLIDDYITKMDLDSEIHVI